MNSACDCCAAPPCLTPTLGCISVSAKCDPAQCFFWAPADPANPSGPEKKYSSKTTDNGGLLQTLTKTVATEHTPAVAATETTAAVDEVNIGDCILSVICSGSITETEILTLSATASTPPGVQGSQTITTTETLDEDCVSHYAYAGSATISIYAQDLDAEGNPIGDGEPTLKTFTSTLSGVDQMVWSNGDIILLLKYGSVFGGYWLYDLEESRELPPPRVGETRYGGAIDKECDLAFEKWPAWPVAVTEPPTEQPPLKSGQGRDCGGFRDWSEATEDPPVEAGAIRSEKKFKWRVTHLPTGTCYLKVWVTTTFTPTPPPDPPLTDPVTPPTPPTPPTVSPPVTYEWIGTGNPCLAVPLASASAENQQINGTENMVDVPAADGITTVQVLKYSCVQGYEPDKSDPENLQPDGYPNPDWEVAAP